MLCSLVGVCPVEHVYPMASRYCVDENYMSLNKSHSKRGGRKFTFFLKCWNNASEVTFTDNFRNNFQV